MARLRISKAARADMRAIFRQSAEMFGLSQADAYVADLHSAFDLIATFPKSGRESRNRQRKVKHGRLRLVCSRWMD